MTSETSGAILERLSRLHPTEIDLSLDRVVRLLGYLGDPHTALAPVVHVAGTNGKGSVIAYLRAFLEAAGLRVHVYTSPHLVRFHERIVLAGAEISEAALVAVLKEVEDKNAGRPITFFEATTAAAFLAMSRTEADIVLLETGLGGRLDATNVVKRPLLSVLTPIALDHQEYLGSHIEAIAAEKSFIMKHGVMCVTAKQDKKTDKIIEMRSLEMGCPTFKEGIDWFTRTIPNGLVYEGKEITATLPAPALQGAHQIRNASLAVAVVEKLLAKGFDIPAEAVAKGLQTVKWPGRLQKLTTGPLVDAVPETWDLWVDGGHNPAAAKALATAVRAFRGKTLHMVLGMSGERDPRPFVKAFGPKVHSLRAVSVPDAAQVVDPALIAENATIEGMRDVGTAADVKAALADIVAANPGLPGVVLITGSLYLVGDVLKENG